MAESKKEVSGTIYRWGIGLLVSAILTMSGYFLGRSSMNTEILQIQLSSLNEAKERIAKDSELERRISVLEIIAVTNKDNIVYIRTQLDKLVGNK